MNMNKFTAAFQKTEPSLMIKMFDMATMHNDVINLGIGEPDFETEMGIIDAGFNAAREGFTHYTPVTGFTDIKQAIMQYWANKYELKETQDEIMVTSGSLHAIYLCLKVMIDPGDEILVADPCFTAYLDQIRYLGGKAVGVPTYEKDGFNITPGNLAKHITEKTKAIILNSPCNPTGAVMDRSNLEGIAALVQKHDLIVISDEVYEAFLFEGEHMPFATLPGMQDRTFTIGGFSKAYAMTGWRIGYVMGPRKAIDVLRQLNTAITYCSNSIAQKSAAYAIRHCDQTVRRMVDIYKDRIEYSVERLNNIPGISCIKPCGSFYLFPNIKATGMTSMEFSMKMIEEARVLVIPGNAFGENGEGFVRIACTVPVDKLDTAFTRMAKALQNI